MPSTAVVSPFAPEAAREAISEIVALAAQIEPAKRRIAELRERVKAFMRDEQIYRLEDGEGHSAVRYEQIRWKAYRDLARVILSAEDFAQVFSESVVDCLDVE